MSDLSSDVCSSDLAADAREVDHPLEGSGVVVARTSDLSITACSFGSSKWAHWDDGRHVVFRLSLGHDGDPVDWCGRSDRSEERRVGKERVSPCRSRGQPYY